MAERDRARRCVFCGNGEMSREHAVPQWIGEVLHSAAGRQGEWTTAYAFGSPIANHNRRHPAEGNRPTVVVKRVCRTCNSGWMADLEGEAKPILEPMINGQPVILTPVDQLCVATWATKTAIVLEFMRSDLFAVSEEARSILAAERRPPDSFRVRIACAGSTGIEPLRLATFVAASNPVDQVPDILCTTMVIGHLIIQVWGGDGAGTTGLQRAGTDNGVAIMTWPPVNGRVSWPPQQPLTDDRLEEFIREPIPGADRPGFLDGWRFLEVEPT